MRALLALPLLGLLLLPVAGAEPDALAKKPMWQRYLTGADADRANVLEVQVPSLVQAGKFEQALASARARLEFRTRKQGADHWQTVNARVQVAHLEQAATLDARDQAQLSEQVQL